MSSVEQRIRVLSRALEHDPDDHEIHLELARLYNSKEDFLQVTRLLEKVVLLNPTLHQASFELGCAYTRLKNFESALKAWEKMVDFDGDLKLGGLDRSGCGSVLNEWNRHLRKSDGSIFDFYQGGLATYVLGKLEAAKEAFDKVASINAEFSRCIYYRSRVLIELKQFEAAMDGLRWSLGRHPDDHRAHYLMGICFMGTARDRQAAEHFKKVVAIQKNHLKTRLRMAEMFLGRNAIDHAIRVLEEALKIHPECAEAFIVKGRCLEANYRLDEAVWAYECARRIDPESLAVHRALGKVFRQLARNKEALVHMKKGVELEPQNHEAHYYLGLVHSDLGQYKEAVNALVEALRLAPKDTFTGVALGEALINMGDYKQAMVVLQQTLAHEPDHRAARLALGRAYVAQGQHGLAMQEFQMLIQANPTDEEALLLYYTSETEKARQSEGV